MLNTEFINKVVTRGALPDGRFFPEEILEMATECLRNDLGAQIIGLRQDYYTRSISVPMAARIEIPGRAIGPVIRDIRVIGDDGVRTLYQVDLSDVSTRETGRPNYFFLEDNIIVAVPKPDAGDPDTVLLRYFLRPSEMVLETQCARITSIDPISGVLQANVPAGWNASNTYDIVSSQPGHKVLSIDMVPNAVGASDIEFQPADLPEFLRVGDYVALAGQTPYPNVPVEAESLLIQLTVSACLDAMGAIEEAARSDKKCDTLRLALNTNLSVRSQGQPKRQRTRLL